MRKSEYIKISRKLITVLFKENCFGKGSLYLETLQKSVPKNQSGKVETILGALVRQNICGKKKKEHGWKYFLNMEKIDKIEEILKIDDDPFRILLIFHNL